MKTDIIPYQKMTAEAILYKENDPLLEKPRDFDPFGHAGLSPLVTI